MTIQDLGQKNRYTINDLSNLKMYQQTAFKTSNQFNGKHLLRLSILRFLNIVTKTD